MLSDIAIRAAKAASKPYRLADEKGLYLEVAPTGGKWWRLKYRFAGKEKRLSLGVYPTVTLRDAREKRDAARKLLANAIDPSVERRIQKASRIERAANSFETVAREWFAKRSPNLAIRTAAASCEPWSGMSSRGSVRGPSPR